MPTFPHSGITNIFRDQVGGGDINPHKPIKSQIRNWGTTVEDWINTLDTEVSAFSTPWEGNLSSAFSYDGVGINMSTTVDTDDSEYRPAMSVSTRVDANGAVPGANPSIPVGLYIQHEQVGTDTDNTMFSHSIMAYARNAAAGDNDVIALSGRASREQVAGGVGDAAGVWGSVYNRSTNAGGSMALEGHSYQVVAGMTAADDYNGGWWSTGLHIRCSGAGSGSPTLAGILIGGNASTSNYSAWNGITITKGTFRHLTNADGVAGTVGLNMGSWDSSEHAEIAVKFGYADGDDSWHLYRGNSGVHVGANLLNVTNPTASGAAGVRAESKGSFNSYFDVQNNGVTKGSFFWDNVADDVNITTQSDIDLVLRRNNSDRIRITLSGATVTGAGGAATGLVLNSADTFNAFFDLREDGATQGQVLWDSTGTRMIVGTTNANELDLRTDSTLAMRVNSDQTAEFYKSLTIFDSLYTKLDSTDWSDITGLIGGTTGGTLIQGPNNSHVVVALRDNGTNDVFAVVSGGGNYMTDTTYDTVPLRVEAGGTVTTNSFITTGEGMTIRRGDGQDVSSDFAVRFQNQESGVGLNFESDVYQWRSQDGGTLYAGINSTGLFYIHDADSSGTGLRLESENESVNFHFSGSGADADFNINYLNSGATDIVLTSSTSTANTLNGLWNFAGGEVRVNGTKVVGAQQAAIPDANSGDAGLQSDINNILAALRAHGLIAT